MAATYTLSFSALTTYAASKNMLAINNATGSGKVLKIYRVWIGTYQTATVSGGIGLVLFKRYVGGNYTGGTAIPFIPHSSCLTANSNTPFTGIGAASGATTITAPGVAAEEIGRIARSTDEMGAGGITMDEIQSIPVMSLSWDAGFSDTNIQPITLRPNECFILATEAVGTYVGSPDITVELTIE